MPLRAALALWRAFAIAPAGFWASVDAEAARTGELRFIIQIIRTWNHLDEASEKYELSGEKLFRCEVGRCRDSPIVSSWIRRGIYPCRF